MKTVKDGSKRAIIIEHNEGWSVKTEMVKNDIILDLNNIVFEKEPDCIEYVKNFFDVKKPAN